MQLGPIGDILVLTQSPGQRAKDSMSHVNHEQRAETTLLEGFYRALLASFLFVFAFLVATHSLAASRVALVVGMGDYAYEPKLRNPPNDEEDVGQALRDIGFTVFEGKDLIKSDLEQELRHFVDAIDNADIALLYYAGHGMQVDGRNYLIPVDARLERRSALDYEVIDVETVLKQMQANSKTSIIILDACRDNPLANQLISSVSRSIAIGRGLATVSNNSIGAMIALSTAPGMVARDGDGRNSPFTAALLRYIRTPGLEIKSLMTRVRADVAAGSQQQQIPWDNESLQSEVFLVPKATVEPANLQKPNACASEYNAETKVDDLVRKKLDDEIQECEKALIDDPNNASILNLAKRLEDQKAFLGAKEAGRPENFKAYLSIYPAGLFANQARERLSAIQASAPAAEIPSTILPAEKPPTGVISNQKRPALKMPSQGKPLIQHRNINFTKTTNVVKTETSYEQRIAIASKCSKQADDLELHGLERKQFREKCKKQN